MTISNSDFMTYEDETEVNDKFKPYILEIKELSDLPCSSSYESNINIVAKIGDVVRIVIDDDSTKEALLKTLLETTDKFNGNCVLTDKDGNNLVESSIRYYINYVPNSLLIDDNTIISNITNGKENLTIENVHEICKLVDLYDYIEALPQGFNTKVDNETNISIVTKYKIVIARELLIDNPIIIFDEPDLFLNAKTRTILNPIIKFLIKNHIVLVFTKVNRKLNLNEITVELCSYDKAKINEDIIYNLQ